MRESLDQGVPVESHYPRPRRSSHKHQYSTDAVNALGIGQPVAVHVAVVTGHQYRQRRPAHTGARVCCLVPAGAVGGVGLPAGHHHTDRERGPARRLGRAQTAAAGGHPPVHAGLRFVCLCAHPLAVDRRAGGAGSGRSRHDGPHHGLCWRDDAQGQDWQRHGFARHHVRGRHGAWPHAGRRVDQWLRLAGPLLRECPAGRAGPVARAPPPASGSAAGEDCQHRV